MTSNDYSNYQKCLQLTNDGCGKYTEVYFSFQTYLYLIAVWNKKIED